MFLPSIIPLHGMMVDDTNMQTIVTVMRVIDGMMATKFHKVKEIAMAAINLSQAKNLDSIGRYN